MSDLALLIQSQIDLQRNAFNLDLQGLEGEARIDAIRWNVLALEDELHEALAETGWKPWARSKHVHETALFGELVDALHFLVNLFALADQDSSSADLAERIQAHYYAKRSVNANRQANGYTGTDKVNGRAVDEPVVVFERTFDGACHQLTLPGMEPDEPAF